MASLGTNTAAAIAFSRFGLGGRPDDAIPASASAWLSSQITAPDPYQANGLPNTAACLAQVAAWRNATGSAQIALQTQISQSLSNEIQAYLLNAVTTRAPFRERLVQFWANHFALMCSHTTVNALAGAYVREAIRPNVTGSFTAMLLAVMQHPAMLYNLDNVDSVGPQSQIGTRCQVSGCTVRGFNENLARECLELHTVGINAGYTQADVDALAMLLTGFTVNLATAPYGFTFNAAMHQPGNQTLMGQTFPGTQAGCIAALTFLATHPATYQHLATELVTHFVSDTPSSADIATVAAALANSGGSLAAAANALIALPSAWVPFGKLRTPQDYVIAVLRATNATASGTNFMSNAANVVLTLGQPVWHPTFPNGYSDLAADWGGPAQMLLRADWINGLAKQITLDPGTIQQATIGPLISPATASAINAAATAHDKLSLLFLAPEFNRR